MIKHIFGKLARLPYLLVVLAPFFWSGNIVVGRGVIGLIPPVALSFWRWLLALIILLPFACKPLKRDWPQIKKGWKSLTVLGFLGITCFNTLLYVAVKTTTAINASVVQTSMPAWVVLLSVVFGLERVSPRQILGVAVCILGSFTIVFHGQWSSLAQLRFVEGDLWVAVAVLLYAIYTIALRFKPAIHELSLLFATFAIGTILLIPVYAWEIATQPAPVVNWQVMLGILYFALFPSIFAYLCWNRGVEMLGASKTGLFTNFVPVFTSIFAVFFLHESLHLYHLAGIVLIFAGMMLFNRKPAAAPAASRAPGSGA